MNQDFLEQVVQIIKYTSKINLRQMSSSQLSKCEREKQNLHFYALLPPYYEILKTISITFTLLRLVSEGE